jgi:hypothetical protein
MPLTENQMKGGYPPDLLLAGNFCETSPLHAEISVLEGVVMRTFLLACVAIGAVTGAAIVPSQAQVVIRAPGIAIGGDPYWQQRHDEARWRHQEEWREAQYQRHDWQRDHCVRDWDGHGYCR